MVAWLSNLLLIGTDRSLQSQTCTTARRCQAPEIQPLTQICIFRALVIHMISPRFITYKRDKVGCQHLQSYKIIFFSFSKKGHLMQENMWLSIQEKKCQNIANNNVSNIRSNENIFVGLDAMQLYYHMCYIQGLICETV